MEKELLTFPKHLSSPQLVQLHVCTFLVLCCDVCIKTVSLYCHIFCRGFMLYLCDLNVFMYTCVKQGFHIRWCLCCLINYNMRHVNCGSETVYSSEETQTISGFRDAQSLVLWVVICRPLFFFLLVTVLYVLPNLQTIPLVSLNLYFSQ